jgi:phospholipid/cholesterol/gamma-HCH transport system substrate-binding protein
VKRETVNYFYVGLFVLATLAVLLYVLFRLTSGAGQRDNYYTWYSNVAGLSRGTPVTYQGYSLGQVGRIEPRRGAGGTRYRVQLQVREGWQIPKDSVARIYSEGLLADTVVNIDEGASPQFLNPGDELKGEQGFDLFAALGSVAGDFGDLSEHAIRPLLETLNRAAQQVGGELETRLPAIMADMQRLVAKLNESADHLAMIVNEDTGLQARRVLDNVDAAAADFRAVGTGLGEVRRDAQKLIRGLDQMVTDNRPELRQAVSDLRHVLEQVSRYSDGVLQNLDSTSRNMSEFSRQIRENPGRLLGGSAPVDREVRRD